jgi:hypothetical protein
MTDDDRDEARELFVEPICSLMRERLPASHDVKRAIALIESLEWVPATLKATKARLERLGEGLEP